jgi:hypothetical protein
MSTLAGFLPSPAITPEIMRDLHPLHRLLMTPWIARPGVFGVFSLFSSFLAILSLNECVEHFCTLCKGTPRTV